MDHPGYYENWISNWSRFIVYILFTKDTNLKGILFYMQDQQNSVSHERNDL